MNHQEIIRGEIKLDTSYLPFIKPKRGETCDVNLPRFFSGWPYFILVVATLLMGSTKVSSQGLPEQENRWAPIQHVIANLETLSNKAASSDGKTGEREEKNRCELGTPNRELASFSWPAPWCSPNATQRNSF